MRARFRVTAFAGAVTVTFALAGPGHATGGQPSAAAQECLAQAVYFEAASEPPEGQRAVAHVVLNRARDRGFPGDVCAVVREGGEQRPCQFGWWCDGRSDSPVPGQRWETAKRVARDALAGRSKDPTDGALYFHRADLGRLAWTRELTRVARIGAHVYYR
jgi:N-acetylmuramoyl-L-alanine amidase